MVSEVKVQEMFELGGLFHDCDVVTFSTDRHNRNVFFVIQIHPMGYPGFKPDYVPDRIGFNFEIVSEISVKAFLATDESKQTAGEGNLRNGWLESVPVKSFEDLNNECPMGIDDIRLVLLGWNAKLEMSGMNVDDKICQFHEIAIKAEVANITDEKGMQRTPEELIEIGERYDNDYEKFRKNGKA